MFFERFSENLNFDYSMADWNSLNLAYFKKHILKNISFDYLETQS